MKMFSSEENCSRMKSSQEYIMCFRGIKEEKAKVGRNLMLWVSDPLERLLTHDMFQII